LKFFAGKGHAVIPSAPLVPENDPTTLFTSSGMQPLVPYLLGQPHPAGKKLVDSQKSFRAQDIEEVGDNRHTTFFEMLGNWSLGDYFKKEQLPWIFEFLTKELGLDPDKLYVTVFAGNKFVPKDTESIEIWKRLFQSVGITAEEGKRICTYPAKKNWWSRSGEPEKMPTGEPGGPDSEVFYDFGQKKLIHENSIYKNEQCHPNCDCGRFLEIANSVFMQYQKQADGSLIELPQKNVDFGGGLERLTAAANNQPDIFRTDLFGEAIQVLNKSNKSYQDNPRPYRIIADHLKAAVFIIAAGVEPSNKDRGYILRRLIRRAALQLHLLEIPWSKAQDVIPVFHKIYSSIYPINIYNSQQTIGAEILKFQTTLERGLKEFNKLKSIDGKTAFCLFQSYGFPWELTAELAQEQRQTINKIDFEKEFKKHQELSRSTSAGMFKGGLADHSETVTKLHTATHLLHAALRKFVGTHVQQKGSNITQERLRFDFTHNSRLTEKERSEIEKWINQQIFSDLPVNKDTTTLVQAKENGALAFFGEKYEGKVTVYTIGNEKTGIVSKEVCGGPHVARTGDLGLFKLGKEETVSAGVRRVYAFLEPK
jgi:alanyl-tRNA synthetase